MSDQLYANVKQKLVDILNKVNGNFVENYVPISDETGVDDSMREIKNMNLKYDPEVVQLFMQNYDNVFAVPEEQLSMKREQFHMLMQELMNLVLETLPKM